MQVVVQADIVDAGTAADMLAVGMAVGTAVAAGTGVDAGTAVPVVQVPRFSDHLLTSQSSHK